MYSMGKTNYIYSLIWRHCTHIHTCRYMLVLTSCFIFSVVEYSLQNKRLPLPWEARGMSVNKNWSFKSRRVQGKWCHLLARLSIHVILSLCACFTFNQGLKGVFFLSFFFFPSNYLLHNSIWKQGTKTVRSFCLGFLISQVMWPVFRISIVHEVEVCDKKNHHLDLCP